MDLEWLLPEQIEQILRLCDLSSIHDPSLAANILEQHHWNLEFALNDLVAQNDEIEHQPVPATRPAPLVHPAPVRPPIEEYNDHLPEEDEFELAPEQYHQLEGANPQPVAGGAQGHRGLLAQQNKEYEEMEKSYLARLAEDEEQRAQMEAREREFEQHKEEFADHRVHRLIQIKFRLPAASHTRDFDLADPVDRLFKYVSGHLRHALEHKYAEFDLTQNFPTLSLKQKMGLTLEEVFGESNGELLIVREL